MKGVHHGVPATTNPSSCYIRHFATQKLTYSNVIVVVGYTTLSYVVGGLLMGVRTRDCMALMFTSGTLDFLLLEKTNEPMLPTPSQQRRLS
jgi:hypothetical protein